MSLNNYHTHTCFCDGKDSPEDLVLEAIRLGCGELGFSGHSYLPVDDSCMSPEGTERYKAEIRRLQEKYRGKLRILLGVEQDCYSPAPVDGYDYVIGSVHYVLKDGVYLSVDVSEELQRQAVREHYAGDWYAFVEDYYSLVGRVRETTACDVVGHFDLVTKFNENGRLFDTGHPRYRKAVWEALDRLCGGGLIFEINTGVMTRSRRSTPYPEDFILTELRKRDIPLILSSDCHDKRFLLYGLAEQKARVPEAREKLFE